MWECEAMSVRGAAAAASRSCLAADNRSSLLCKRHAINSVRAACAGHGSSRTCAMKGIDAILPSARCFHHERPNVRWPSLNGSLAIWNGKGLEQATYCEEMSGCSINGHRWRRYWRFNERSDRGLAKVGPDWGNRGVRAARRRMRFVRWRLSATGMKRDQRMAGAVRCHARMRQRLVAPRAAHRLC